MKRRMPFTFRLVRGDERRQATWYALSERKATAMAVAWAVEHGWTVR